MKDFLSGNMDCLRLKSGPFDASVSENFYLMLSYYFLIPLDFLCDRLKPRQNDGVNLNIYTILFGNHYGPFFDDEDENVKYIQNVHAANYTKSKISQTRNLKVWRVSYFTKYHKDEHHKVIAKKCLAIIHEQCKHLPVFTDEIASFSSELMNLRSALHMAYDYSIKMNLQ